jgi:hypothetical protein
MADGTDEEHSLILQKGSEYPEGSQQGIDPRDSHSALAENGASL